MYNWRNRMKFVLTLWIVLLFWVWSNVFWFDLGEELYSSFKKITKSDSFMETPYAESYSKDPFKDALNDIENMSMQVKLAWVEYVESALAERKCTMSPKKIQAILYYFVPEFREDIVKSLKVNLWEYNSKKFIFDSDEIYKYCREFYYCDMYGKESEWTTSDQSNNVRDRCETFFTENYEKWRNGKQNNLDVQISQLWADKYRNATVDDSPYDILVDLSNVGVLLYTEVEHPITPVFYNLPMFSKSKEALKEHKEYGSSYGDGWKWDGNWNGEWAWSSGGWSLNPPSDLLEWWDNWEWDYNWWFTTNPTPLPVIPWKVWSTMEWIYDSLVEWLWALSVNQDNSVYYWSLCNDEEERSQPAYEQLNPSDEVVNPSFWYDDEELEELINYMKWAVDNYSKLPPEKEEEIKLQVGKSDGSVADNDPTQLEKLADEVKTCYKSCEGLRIDQKASCMLMCACWEYRSPIFNPEETPWLWPILMIRFCTVPAVDTKFSVWGRKIVSIQEWVNEIYGVVDKLSREGRLWIWTQQYNFLDSTTKKIKIWDALAFSVSVELGDIALIPPKRSEQYLNLDIKDANKQWQMEYRISNDLDNPVLKNRYRTIGTDSDNIKDISATANAGWTKESQANLSISPAFWIDPVKNSRSNRYVQISETLDRWLDQQWNLWVQILSYIDDSYRYAAGLYAKPKI